jgi:tRNA threonylcarbamoyladenosine biosynthesis protein TsaB
MTLYLAIETATDAGSVAVGRPGTALAEIAIAPQRHAADVLPAAEQVLERVGGTFDQLDGIVVGDGPGSFTGLRIGLATAKGLAMGREDLAFQAVPSLMAAAWNGRRITDGSIAALYDALRGEVYAAVYRFAGDAVETVVAPRLTTVEALAARGGSPPGVAVGDGAAAFADAVRAWTGAEPVGPPDGAPCAAALLELLAVRGAARSVTDVAGFEPDYGRPPAAQDRWEREHGRPLPHPTGDAG